MEQKKEIVIQEDTYPRGERVRFLDTLSAVHNLHKASSFTAFKVWLLLGVAAMWVFFVMSLIKIGLAALNAIPFIGVGSFIIILSVTGGWGKFLKAAKKIPGLDSEQRQSAEHAAKMFEEEEHKLAKAKNDNGILYITRTRGQKGIVGTIVVVPLIFGSLFTAAGVGMPLLVANSLHIKGSVFQILIDFFIATPPANVLLMFFTLGTGFIAIALYELLKSVFAHQTVKRIVDKR